MNLKEQMNILKDFIKEVRNIKDYHGISSKKIVEVQILDEYSWMKELFEGSKNWVEPMAGCKIKWVSELEKRGAFFTFGKPI